MVVPVLGEAKALKAEKLLATVEKTEPLCRPYGYAE
jgi:hypothetical protein